MSTVESDQEILTVEETAQLLRVHPKTVREAYHDGSLPGRRVGKKVIRFHRSVVLEWVRGQGGVSRSRRKK